MSAFTRRVATSIATVALGLGVASVATPAHAVIDTSWGQSSSPTPAR